MGLSTGGVSTKQMSKENLRDLLWLTTPVSSDTTCHYCPVFSLFLIPSQIHNGKLGLQWVFPFWPLLGCDYKWGTDKLSTKSFLWWTDCQVRLQDANGKNKRGSVRCIWFLNQSMLSSRVEYNCSKQEHLRFHLRYIYKNLRNCWISLQLNKIPLPLTRPLQIIPINLFRKKKRQRKCQNRPSGVSKSLIHIK